MVNEGEEEGDSGYGSENGREKKEKEKGGVDMTRLGLGMENRFGVLELVDETDD